MKLHRHLCFFLLITIISCGQEKRDHSSSKLDIDAEITIDEIQQAFQNGEYTITQLTQFYIDRINALSMNGPRLNAVIVINPDALSIAAQLDEELQKGDIRGPLHGIPVLLKDNIDTGDKMPCTAGARPMEGSLPLSDSPLAAQLREAGAVILGKANLSEWANFHSNFSSSGWSGLGGQTRNPYDISRNPCGSSSGSAVAVAANLCVLAIGTETNGSIVCPANNNGIVGIKPTVGLVSRTGIIPIAYSQDTGGPLARTVRDATICLGWLTAPDPKDSLTLNPDRKAYPDYTPFLNVDGIQGKRIGYYKTPLGDHWRLAMIMEEAVNCFRENGATIIELEEVLPREARKHSYQVLLYEFKDGLNKYLRGLGPDAPVKSLQDLVEKTFKDTVEMRYYDHETLKTALSKSDLNSPEYLNALDNMHRLSREMGIDRVMNDHDLDAIISPTGSPAWKTDLTSGDNFGVSSSSPAAIAGYPNVTVPMGQIDGLPVGISIFGRPWSEPVLIEIAYAYEQVTRHRMTPKFIYGE